MRTYSTWLPTVAERTVGTWICALVMAKVNGSLPRRMVSVTLVPSGPWMRAVAWSAVLPLLSLSPTFRIWAPLFHPSSAADQLGSAQAGATGQPQQSWRQLFHKSLDATLQPLDRSSQF